MFFRAVRGQLSSINNSAMTTSTTETKVAISADKGIPKTNLDQLSKQTSLPLLSPKIKADYLLHITTDYLELRKIIQTGKKQKIESIHIDFVTGKANHRRLHGGGKGQDIAKAIGLHKIKHPTVLDLTAGMGGDAFVLASLGAQVTLVERNLIVHALLNDAFGRAALSADPEFQTILKKMTLLNHDANSVLDKLDNDDNHDDNNDLPDVIYLDPMFPERNKSAQVKKEMRFFHDIVGSDTDSEALLLNALTKAKKRIVVKRPRLAETLTQHLKPTFEISGKSTRYDIYLPKNSNR